LYLHPKPQAAKPAARSGCANGQCPTRSSSPMRILIR
jgi:hypothetical protein